MSTACRFLLRCASLMVPRESRSEWLAEWQGELWHVRHHAFAFCLGAFRDAAWWKSEAWKSEAASSPAERRLWPRSAWRCILLLALLAIASVGYAWRCHTVLVMGADGSMAAEHPIFTALAPAVLALLLLRVGTPLALGEYPAGPDAPPPPARARRWIYLVAKIALLLPIVYCGTLDLSSLVGAGRIQAHALIVAFFLAFRWALRDQRQRCPVCLGLLTHPARIGMASQMFLDWYGTELICARGHGLLHVPEIPNSCYATQRWTYLDPSWRSLF